MFFCFFATFFNFVLAFLRISWFNNLKRGDTVDIGERIKRRRKELGLSAEQVAERLGVSPATIYRYESNDIVNMRIDKLEPIAKVLRTTPAHLMGWEDESSQPDKEMDDVEPMLNDLKSKAAEGITLMYDGKPIDKKTMKAFEASLEAAIALLEASKKEDD